MRKYAQIYKQKVVFLTETTLTLDEVRKNFGDDAIWLDVTEFADVGVGYIQGLDAEGRFKLIPPTVDDMNGVSEKERRTKIMLILMTNLKSKYNKLAMDNGFVSIDDALLATVTNEATDSDLSVASQLGEKYYHQRGLVRNYFTTEHYQYYKGDYQFFRLTDIDKILEDAKPAEVEKVTYPDPVPGTPAPADPPNFDWGTVTPTDNLGDDIPELPPVPSDDHTSTDTTVTPGNTTTHEVPTNEDNDGDIPTLPPIPKDNTDTSSDIPELPPVPSDDHTTTGVSDDIPALPGTGDLDLPELPNTNTGEVIKPPTAEEDNEIPALPPTTGEDDDTIPAVPGVTEETHTEDSVPPTPSTSESTTTTGPKIPTTLPDGSPLPANAVVDPKTGIITIDTEDYVTIYYPDGRSSVSPKDRL